MFSAFRQNVGEPRRPFQSNAVAALKQSHSKWGWHRQRGGNERGPVILLTNDFIPRVKGLFSVTFTWFKSLTHLNQKSMKSLRYIFGLSCQHFKLYLLFSTCQAIYIYTVYIKKGELSDWLGWNLTTHWKILPIAVMGSCRNGKYTRRIKKVNKNKRRQPILTKTLLVINFMRDMDKYSINSCCSLWYKHSSASTCMTSRCRITYIKCMLHYVTRDFNNKLFSHNFILNSWENNNLNRVLAKVHDGGKQIYTRQTCNCAARQGQTVINRH